MPSNQSIAIIDDDPTLLTLLYTILTEHGYPNITAGMSEHAYAIVYTLRPSLLILDIDARNPTYGWHIIKRIRRDALTTQLPILICSTNIQLPQYLMTTLTLTAVDFLEKPFDTETLLAKVTALLAAPS